MNNNTKEDILSWQGTLSAMVAWVDSEIDGAITEEVAEDLEFDRENLLKMKKFLDNYVRLAKEFSKLHR